jgi:tight adherence protein C
VIGILLAAGAALGAGITLIVRGLRPPLQPLAQALAEFNGPRDPAPLFTGPLADGHGIGAPAGSSQTGAGWVGRWGRLAVPLLSRLGLPRSGVRRDLTLLSWPVEAHLAEQATAALVGALLAPMTAGVLFVGGVRVPALVPLWGCGLLGIGGFFTPDLAARSNARQRRRAFTHALSGFLDLVVVALAGGAGVEAALNDAARIGTGWAFDQLRRTLDAAAVTRTTPWTALNRLGEEYGIGPLRELAAALALAGTEGAKADALRLRELTDAESTALAATEAMSLPVIGLFAGFMIFVGYPAITHILSAL